VKIPYFSILLLSSIVLFSFFGFTFYHINPNKLDATSILLAPSMEHLMGTDRLGRDILARIIEGGQISLTIGFLSATIASFLGLILGVSAGFFQKKFDKLLTLSIDLFLTFPTFFLLLTLVSYINASSLTLIVIISLTSWMGTARLIRSESFSMITKPYIKILKIAKVGNFKILFKYYTPLLLPIFLVSLTFGIGGAILAESGLSFLGLGVMAPQISWGTILSNSKDVMDIAWWLSFFPGLMIFLVTFSLVNISNYIQEISNKKRVTS